MNPSGQFVIEGPGDTLISDYNDLSNRPTIPNVTRTTSSLSLSLVGTGATGTQIHATKDATIHCTCSTSVTVTLGGSPVSRIILKICSTNSATEGNWTEISRTSTSQPTTLTVTVGGVYTQEGMVSADVPATWYAKLVPSGTGTHLEAFVSGQQTVYG